MMRLNTRTVVFRSLGLGLVAMALVFASAIVKAAIAPADFVPDFAPSAAIETPGPGTQPLPAGIAPHLAPQPAASASATAIASQPQEPVATPASAPQPALDNLPDPYAGRPDPLPEVPRPTPSYVPQQVYAPAHPTNFGERVSVDINGNPVYNDWIIVLHETVGSASSAVNTFQTPHYNEDDQVSYHALIQQNGTVVYVVPPEKRAFGAGNSVFMGANGAEAVRTHAAYPPSVNNFAYHISLETPSDGRGNGSRHSGYTQAQYQSLAWLVAQTRVPDSRITTHQAVDRSGNRRDPRSFNGQYFLSLLHQYPRA